MILTTISTFPALTESRTQARAKLTIFSTNTDTDGEPPFPVRADSIYKGENKMPEQNSITKNVKLKSERQTAKCRALSSRLFFIYEITAALLQSIFKNFLNQLCNTVVII